MRDFDRAIAAIISIFLALLLWPVLRQLTTYEFNQFLDDLIEFVFLYD